MNEKTKQSGIIMQINGQSGYSIITGVVTGTAYGNKNGNNWYLLKLKFQEGNEEKNTDIWFWDDNNADDYRRYRADNAKRKNVHNGSSVTVRCKFRDESKKEANGYSIHYDGLIKVKPDSEHEKDDRSVVIGTVTSMKDGKVKGQDAVKLNVYAGKKKSGDETIYRHISVTITGDKANMARVDFNGTENSKKKAVFRCGSVGTYYSKGECECCYGVTKYDASTNNMVCEDCGCMYLPAEEKKRESVFAYDYIITGEKQV